MRAELEKLKDWLDKERSVALAVVLSTWGSAPRPAGSLMLVDGTGRFHGSVSGGCVEGAVVAEATALLMEDTPTLKTLHFGVSSETAFEAGLACGGTIDIALVTICASEKAAIGDALEHLAADTGCRLNWQNGQVDCAPLNGAPSINPASLDGDTLHLICLPQRDMIIIGAVHIAEFLVPMATMLGFNVTVIDPRAAFVEDRTLPGATVIEDWPDDVLAARAMGPATALVLLTHDPKIDDAALIAVAEMPPGYIGALGSKKTHAARRDRLMASGLSTDFVDRIYGPIGLHLGGRSPAEIAVSIMAQIIQQSNAQSQTT